MSGTLRIVKFRLDLIQSAALSGIIFIFSFFLFGQVHKKNVLNLKLK